MTAERAVELSQRLLEAVGIVGWSARIVRFTDYPKRFGLCSRSNKRIDLNWIYLTDDGEMRETIIHEVAHALIPDAERAKPGQDEHEFAAFRKSLCECARAFQKLESNVTSFGK